MLNRKFIPVISAVIIIAIAELYLRSAMPHLSPHKLLRYSNIPGLVNELNPNTKIKFEGLFVKIPPTTIEISSQGLRDCEYSYAKLKNTKRIAILGDSIAFGWGVENVQCFPRLLENTLNLSFGKVKFQVLNFAVPGYNLEQELITLREKVLKFNVDYVLIYCINRDFEEPVMEKNIFWKLFEHSYIIRMAYFSYRKILGKFNVSFGNYSYYYRGANKVMPIFESLTRILKENNIKLIFVFHNIAHDDISGLENLKRAFKRNNTSFFVINNYPHWSQAMEIPKDYHPNAGGHKIIAETLFYFLKDNKFLDTGNY